MKNNKGLTLLELMLVMLILIIIAAFMVPTLSGSYRKFFEITTNYRMQGELLTVMRDIQGRMGPSAQVVNVTDTSIQWRELTNFTRPVPLPSDFVNAANYTRKEISYDTGDHVLYYYPDATNRGNRVVISRALKDVTKNGVTYPAIKFTRIVVPNLGAGANSINVEMTASAPIRPGGPEQTVYGRGFFTLLCRSAQ